VAYLIARGFPRSTRCSYGSGDEGTVRWCARGLLRRTMAYSAFGLLAIAAGAARAAPDPLVDCGKDVLARARARVFAGEDLQPTILSADLLHLGICVPGGEPLNAAAQRKLEAGYEVREVPLTSLPTAELKSAAICPSVGECRAEIYRRKDLESLGDPQKFGLSGGLPFAAFLGHVGKKGHFEITTVALQAPSVKASADSVAVMAAASRDADFYEWSVPAAHAQTPNLPDGRIDPKRFGGSQGAFLRWVQAGVRRVAAQCSAGQPRLAAYALGYAMHAVQDLAFHEGITNAEHSFRDYDESQKVGIDFQERYDEKFDLATAASLDLLRKVRAVLPASCWDHMIHLQNTSPLGASEKQQLLGKKSTDFGVVAFIEYRVLASRVSAQTVLPNANLFVTPRWLTPPRKDSMKAILGRLNLDM
jgi:hypothetical protein